MQDLNMLLSAFTAKPWRQGFSNAVAFMFRTKAAAAYATNQSIMRITAAAAAPMAAQAKPQQVQQTFDSKGVADGDRKASMYGDDSELCAECAHGSVVISVTATAGNQGGANQL
jgi:hypothetical protein